MWLLEKYLRINCTWGAMEYHKTLNTLVKKLMFSALKNKAKHGEMFSALKTSIFYEGMKNTSKFREEMLYILSALKFIWSLLVFHGGNVHFRLIPLKIISLGQGEHDLLCKPAAIVDGSIWISRFTIKFFDS